MTRTYAQFCPAARALDVLGPRWSLLIVRELLLGSRRYTDLIAGLPGIGPNVLADRLRDLREAGVVTQATLPPPAGVTVYELTGVGEELRPVVDALSGWGMRLLDAPRPGDRFQLGWLLGCLRAGFRPEAARGLHETWEFRVDGDPFHVRVDDGGVDVRHGPATDPACVLTADLATFMAVGARLLPLEQAVAQGVAEVAGDPAAAARSIEVLGPHLQATGGRHGIIGAVGARFQPDRARGIHETYEFRVGDLAFHARVDDGTVEMAHGPAADAPAARITADLAVLLGLGAGTVDLHAALLAGTVVAEGDPDAAVRAAAAFGVRT